MHGLKPYKSYFSFTNNTDSDQVVDFCSIPKYGSLHYVGESIGGGILFYIFDDGLSGLVAHPSDLGSWQPWGSTSIKVGVETANIGYGKTNTNAIIAANGVGLYAAYSCSDLNSHDYDDWYLPSSHELIEMYSKKDIIGGFNTSHIYWSSTETLLSTTDAIAVDFSTGLIDDFGALSKASLRYVRPIRTHVFENPNVGEYLDAVIGGGIVETGFSNLSYSEFSDYCKAYKPIVSAIRIDGSNESQIRNNLALSRKELSGDSDRLEINPPYNLFQKVYSTGTINLLNYEEFRILPTNKMEYKINKGETIIVCFTTGISENDQTQNEFDIIDNYKGNTIEKKEQNSTTVLSADSESYILTDNKIDDNYRIFKTVSLVAVCGVLVLGIISLANYNYK